MEATLPRHVSSDRVQTDMLFCSSLMSHQANSEPSSNTPDLPGSPRGGKANSVVASLGTRAPILRSAGMRESQENTVGEIVELIPSLRAYARALTRDAVDADDLVQETLTKAIANVASFTPGTKLRAWLFTIMRNSFYNSVVKRQREQTGAADCVSGSAVEPGRQENHLMGQELIAAINKLPHHYREMLILVIVLGESYETAAKICNCAVGTVKSRVNRARNMVIEMLHPEVRNP